MEGRRKSLVTFTVTLEEWEANALRRLLGRIDRQQKVSKSEFSQQEKIVGRQLVSTLTALNGLGRPGTF